MSYNYSGYRRRQYDLPQPAQSPPYQPDRYSRWTIPPTMETGRERVNPPRSPYAYNAGQQPARQPSCWEPPPYKPPDRYIPPVQPRRATCWDPPGSRVEVLRPPSWPDPEPPYVSHRLDPPERRHRMGYPPIGYRDRVQDARPRHCGGYAERGGPLSDRGEQRTQLGFDRHSIHATQPLRPKCWDPPAQQQDRSYPAFDHRPRRAETNWDRPHHQEEVRAPRVQSACHQSRYTAEQPPHPILLPRGLYGQPARVTRQRSCWDPPCSRVPMGSLAYEESASIYYPNYDCDSDGYDEEFDVGYISQHMDETANDFDQRRTLRPPSHCRSATATLPIPPQVADPRHDQRLSRPYLRHDPSSSSLPPVADVSPPTPQRSSMTSHCHSAAPLPAVAAVPSLNLSPTAPSCSPDDDSGEESGLLDEPPPPAVLSPPCIPYISGEEETLLDDDEEVVSIEEMKKIVASFDAARMTSQDVVEKCLGENGGALLRKFSKDSLCVDERKFTFDSVFEDKSGDLLDPELEIKDEARNGSAFARIQRPCTFDPGGDNSPKTLLSTLYIASWFPP